MENQIILALKNNKLLDNILFDELNLDNIKGQLITKSEGEILFRDSDDATSLYLVVSGEINVLKKQENQKTESAVIGENDFFGADGFLQQGKRKSTAVILRDSYIISLSKAEVDNLIEQNPAILNNLYGAVEDDIQTGGEVPAPTDDTQKADVPVEDLSTPQTPEEQPGLKIDDGLSLEGFDDINISEQPEATTPSAPEKEPSQKPPVQPPQEQQATDDLSLDDLKLDDIPGPGKTNDINLDENLPSDKIEITDDDINLDENPLDDFKIPDKPSDETMPAEEKPDDGLDLSDLSIDDISINDGEKTTDLSMDDFNAADAKKPPDQPVEDVKPADEDKTPDHSFSDLVAEASEKKPDLTDDNITPDDAKNTLDLSLDDMTIDDTEKTPDLSLDDLTPPAADKAPDLPVEDKTTEKKDKSSGLSFDDLEAAGEEKTSEPSLDDLKIPEGDLGSDIDLSVTEPEPPKEKAPPPPPVTQEPENEKTPPPPPVTPEPDIVSDDIIAPVGEVPQPPEEKVSEEMKAAEVPQPPPKPAPPPRKAKFSGENSFELLEKINDAAQLVNSNIKIDDVLQNIVKVATDLTSADRGTLYLLDKEKNELWSKIAMGNEFKEIRLKVGNGIAGWVAQKGEIINLDNAQEDSRFNVQFDKSSGYVTKSMLCFPMKDRNGEICGVLQLLNSKNGNFSNVDEELLEALSIHASMALQNAELVEQLLKGERVFSLGKMANFLIQDIKKPVMVSKRYTEHLKSKDLPEESMKVVDMLLDQLDHIAELVNSTSNYAEGQIVSRSQLKKLNEVLKDFVEKTDSYIKSRNCTLASDFEKDVNVQISEKQFYQAFQHLIKNACDAMPDGGEIAVFTDIVDNHVTITVKDSGLGIPETLHEKIFEPFMSHGKKEGTGLGLSITKKIIEEHGGTISVESDIGEGAKFIISLPIASSQQ